MIVILDAFNVEATSTLFSSSFLMTFVALNSWVKLSLSNVKARFLSPNTLLSSVSFAIAVSISPIFVFKPWIRLFAFASSATEMFFLFRILRISTFDFAISVFFSSNCTLRDVVTVCIESIRTNEASKMDCNSLFSVVTFAICTFCWSMVFVELDLSYAKYPPVVIKASDNAMMIVLLKRFLGVTSKGITGTFLVSMVLFGFLD